MKLRPIFLPLLLLFFLTLPATAQEKKESVFDRVMRTGTIRCGYWSWEPLFIVDTNTKKMSGIFKDVMEEIARVSQLKIEWVREVAYADVVPDLNTGKIDVMCAGMWPSALRARHVEFTPPILFTTINAYKRAGDGRFDNNKESINDPSVTAAVMDGEMSTEIKNTDFPKTKALSMVQMSGVTDLWMAVAEGKADITFTDSINGARFMKNNPDKIVPVKLPEPLRVMPSTFGVAGGEARLNYFLTESLRQLHNDGTIERILKKYDSLYPPGSFIRTAKPYEGER